MLTRDQLLAAKTLEPRRLWVPEWNAEVLLAKWSGAVRGAWEHAYAEFRKNFMGSADDDTMFWAHVAAWSIVDDKGQRLILEADVQAFAQNNPGDVVIRIGHIAGQMNAVGAWAREDMEKNSAAAPSS